MWHIKLVIQRSLHSFVPDFFGNKDRSFIDLFQYFTTVIFHYFSNIINPQVHILQSLSGPADLFFFVSAHLTSGFNATSPSIIFALQVLVFHCHGRAFQFIWSIFAVAFFVRIVCILYFRHPIEKKGYLTCYFCHFLYTPVMFVFYSVYLCTLVESLIGHKY